LQGEYAMAKPHDTQDQETFQEHPMVKDLLAELQAVDAKVRLEVRFYALMSEASQNDM
jgi:hypothetical protein